MHKENLDNFVLTLINLRFGTLTHGFIHFTLQIILLQILYYLWRSPIFHPREAGLYWKFQLHIHIWILDGNMNCLIQLVIVYYMKIVLSSVKMYLFQNIFSILQFILVFVLIFTLKHWMVLYFYLFYFFKHHLQPPPPPPHGSQGDHKHT